MAFLKRNALPLLSLLLVTVIAFYELPAHEMLATWDDQLYVSENPAIRGFTSQAIKLAFTNYYAGNYAPIQILSYMLDYTLWGENPFGYFLANICYHFASGVLLYFLLLRLGFQAWGAALGCALFLAHPVQVESVAWLSQRKTLLAMLFYLAAFHAWLNYRSRQERRRAWYAVSLMMFTLALLAKSVAVIFPLLLMLYDVLVEPLRSGLKAHAAKLPFLAVAGAVAALALISQSPEMHGGRIPYPANPWITIPLTMLPVLASYLRLLFWPDPASLCIMYFPTVRYHLDGAVLFSSLAAAALVALGWYFYRNHRHLLFWYLAFFLGLLPVAQIVPIATLMNERYLYFPLMGVAALVAAGSDCLRCHIARPLLRNIVIGGMAGSIILLALASNSRCLVWRNGIELFGDAVVKLPGERDPWLLLAESYNAVGAGQTAEKLYEKAASLGPLGENDQLELAKIYLESGKLDKARELLLTADRTGTSGAAVNLALSCVALKLDRQDESVAYLATALRKGLTLDMFKKNEECANSMLGNPRYETVLKPYQRQ
jgi:tetratricopeptide (TPR) repeat protein